MRGLLVHQENLTKHMKQPRRWKWPSKLQLKHLFWPCPTPRSVLWCQPSYQKTKEIMMQMTKTHFFTFNRLNLHFQSIHSISVVVPSIASTREGTCAKHVFTWRQTSEFQVSNVAVFTPKCEVLVLGTAQREDVCNQQERKKLSERCPTFKRFAESSKRTCAGLLFFRSWAKITHQQGCSFKNR